MARSDRAIALVGPAVASARTASRRPSEACWSATCSTSRAQFRMRRRCRRREVLSRNTFGKINKTTHATAAAKNDMAAITA